MGYEVGIGKFLMAAFKEYRYSWFAWETQRLVREVVALTRSAVAMYVAGELLSY